MERTLVLIKPDAVNRGLIGEIIKRFENRTFRIKAMKIINPSRELVERHYEMHRGKPHFDGVVKFMSSGTAAAIILEGDNAVLAVRKMIGNLDPSTAIPGTIRGDFTLRTTENLIHGSDSIENAEREIAVWFKPEEILP